MNILNIVNEARAKEARESNAWQKMIEEHERERIAEDAAAHSNFLRFCTSAKVSHYEAWLTGYLKQGGKISHVYNYPMPDEFLVVRKSDNVKISALYGASAKSIIVPWGVSCECEENIGHNNVYFMDGFKVKGNWVPCYSDMF